MKKLLALALALVMVFSATLSISAATDDNDLTPDNNSVDVKVTINGTKNHKYAVDLEFGSLAFSTVVSTEWDTEEYDYDIGKNSDWTCAAGADQIKVINHSDLPINYSITAAVSEDGEKLGDLSISVENASGQVRACTTQDTPNQVYAVATVSVSGAPTQVYVTNAKLGTVTVSVSKVDNPTNN